MAGIRLDNPYADARRATILEAERRAGDLGIQIDAEKRREIIQRFDARLAQRNQGWGFEFQDTVVQVDGDGIARLIPISQANAWAGGGKTVVGRAGKGRKTPHRERVQFQDPGEQRAISMREGAFNFYARIRDAIERTGYIPGDLQAQLCAEGWKYGTPVPMDKVQAWCNDFTAQVQKKYPKN